MSEKKQCVVCGFLFVPKTWNQKTCLMAKCMLGIIRESMKKCRRKREGIELQKKRCVICGGLFEVWENPNKKTKVTTCLPVCKKELKRRSSKAWIERNPHYNRDWKRKNYEGSRPPIKLLPSPPS